MNWWWQMVNKERDFIGIYIQYSPIHTSIAHREFSKALHFLGSFKNQLHQLEDRAAEEELSKLENLLLDILINDKEEKYQDVLISANKINNWLALGAKGQKLGLGDTD